MSKRAEEAMTTNGFGVILEEFREIFKGLGEGQKILSEQMERVEGRMDSMETEMRSGFKRIDGLEIEMRSSFKTVMEYLARIDTELQEIKAELSQKAQIKEVKELHGRVLKLELELASLRNSLHPQKV